MNLCAILAIRWSNIDAHYHALNKSLLRLEPSRLLGFVMTWCVQNMESEEKLKQFMSDIKEPLPWQDPDGTGSEASESDSFFEMQQKAGG